MTDDDLGPEQQEIRRLLAAARHDEPVPQAVVDRLDRVLSDLADDPVRIAPVSELATRRRRVTSLLLAAAAAVAIGVGVGQVVGTGTTGSDETSAASRDEAGAEAQGADAEGAEPGTQVPSADAPHEEQAGGRIAEIGRSTLAEDVSALRGRSYSAALVDGQAGAYDAAGATCRAEGWGRGQFIPVRYGGIPAVLVFRRATDDSQVADLFLCGDSEPRRSVTLPAP